MGFETRHSSKLTAPRQWLWAFAGLALVLLSTAVLRAQELDAETRTAARELARKGADAFESKNYSNALDSFDRAYALFPAPSIAVMQARALSGLNRFVEALDKYEETQRMQLAEGAPDAYRQAVHDAAREGEELRQRIPRLAIRIQAAGARPEGLSVVLDGKPVPKALLDVERPVDPGQHQVVARAPGYEPVTRTLKLLERERATLDLSLQPTALDSSGTTATASRSPDRETSATTGRDPVWGLVALGAGAAAVSVSAITGIVALNKKSDLDAACRPACPESSREDIDSFRTNRTISYTSLAIGLTSAGIGSYLLLSGSRDSAHVAASVSPAAIGLRGVF